MFGNGISLADIAAVTKNNGDDGFGGGNGWWVLVLLWALGGRNGWGNENGNGNNCGSSGGYLGAEVQRGFDTQSIIQKLDGLNSGLCSLGYDQLAQMNNINSNITQTGYSIQNQINQDAIANMQQFNALQTNLNNCCCENRQAIAQVRYDMATDTCAITSSIKDAAAAIMQNDNNNYRQLHDEQVALQMQAMRDQLAQKDTLINMMNLRGSQAEQTVDIVNQVYDRLARCPVGTYGVCNPNAVQVQLQNGGCCTNGYQIV